ncbi:COG4223 family protein [Candidatus Phycosocius spiralis]|uniref:Membrane protein n=1 Tax=Candidatus Phycosocius spiralis TaxID=2815099 RepID=A0ABQ4PW27_9PROT|nr:hypothetical protein [Candidatus Phycosocius spiralis]GIU67197.1 membrane protein [Candidatus Phycosocius spiralis]
MAENITSTTSADSPDRVSTKTDQSPATDPFLDAQLRAATAPIWSTSPTNQSSTHVRVRRGIGFGTALSLSIAASFCGAGVTLSALSHPHWMRALGLDALIPPIFSTTANTKVELSIVQARLVALENRVQALTQFEPLLSSGDAKAEPPETVDRVINQIKGIAGRVTAIETRLAALDPTGAGGAIIAGLQAEIASLKVMVQALQTQAALTPSAGVTFAVVNLVEAANRPGPFWPEFETVRAALPGVSEVEALEPFARTGVPTRALLQERFATLPAALAASNQKATKAKGILEWLKALFADMIKVERVTTANDTSAEANLLRAKSNLDQGDLAAALEEVKAINPAPELIAQWIKGAQDRLTLESRLAAIRGAVERGSRPPQSVTNPTSPTKGQYPNVAIPANPPAIQKATP